MKRKRQPLDFVRPMLNSPVRESTADAELFIKRAITRLETSHQANLLTEYLYVGLSTLDFQQRSSLVESRQSLQDQYSL